jgi:hypothetical protein
MVNPCRSISLRVMAARAIELRRAMARLAGGDQDCVERRSFGPAHRAVAHAKLAVVLAEPPHAGASSPVAAIAIKTADD